MNVPKTNSPVGFVKQHFLSCLLAAYLCAGLFPALGVRIRAPLSPDTDVSLVHLMLSVLLLTLGLSTPVSEIRQVLRECKWVGSFFGIRLLSILVISVVSQWMPTELSGLATGLILLLAAPTAASSSGWSLQLGASKATTVALVLGTTLLCVMTGPWLLQMSAFLAADETAGSLRTVYDSFQVTFALPWVVLPMVLGMIFRSYKPTWAENARRFGLNITPFILLLLNYSNASSSLPRLADEVSGTYLIVTLVASVILFLVLASSTWMSSGWLRAGDKERVSTLIGTSMSNTGFMFVIASMALPTRADIHLPIIAFTFVQHLGLARFAKADEHGASSFFPVRLNSLLATKLW